MPSTLPGHRPQERSLSLDVQVHSSAVDAFFRIDVAHRGFGEIRLVLLRMNSIDGAYIHTSRVFRIDIGCGNDVSQLNLHCSGALYEFTMYK